MLSRYYTATATADRHLASAAAPTTFSTSAAWRAYTEMQRVRVVDAARKGE